MSSKNELREHIEDLSNECVLLNSELNKYKTEYNNAQQQIDETRAHVEQPDFTCSNLRAQCSDLQSECRCLRKERDIAQDELKQERDRGMRPHSTVIAYNQIEPCQQESNCPALRKTWEELRKTLDMYDARGKQLERYSEMHEQLCHERNEARAWARQLYGRLEWWGGVCECGGIKKTNDDAMKCATCGKQGWNRGWE